MSTTLESSEEHEYHDPESNNHNRADDYNIEGSLVASSTKDALVEEQGAGFSAT